MGMVLHGLRDHGVRPRPANEIEKNLNIWFEKQRIFPLDVVAG